MSQRWQWRTLNAAPSPCPRARPAESKQTVADAWVIPHCVRPFSQRNVLKSSSRQSSELSGRVDSPKWICRHFF
jgi:hypothetical protein